MRANSVVSALHVAAYDFYLEHINIMLCTINVIYPSGHGHRDFFSRNNILHIEYHFSASDVLKITHVLTG